MRDIVSAGPHVGCSPSGDGHGLRPVTVILDEPLDQHGRRFPAELPCGPRRQGAAVHRKKIPPGRQDVKAPAGWRAGRAGRHEPAVQRRHQSVDFRSSATANGRKDVCAHILQNRVGQFARRFGASFDYGGCQKFEPLDRIACGSPRIRTDAVENLRFARSPPLGHVAVERIEFIGQTDIKGQRSRQRSVFFAVRAPRHSDQRRNQVALQGSFRRLSENMQAIPNLAFLDFAQIGVKLP